MNIILTVTTLYKGGAERVVTNLANALVDKGHNVEVLLYKESKVGYPLDKRVTLKFDKVGLTNPIAHIFWRRKYIKHRNPNIVISFLDQLNIINILALLGARTPIIVANRDDPRYSPHNPIVRIIRNFLFHFTDGIVVQNQHNLDYFSSRLRKKSTIIYNAVNMNGYENKAIISPKLNKIVWVGRLTKQKNPQMMIKAFYKFSKEHSDYRLYMYGDGVLRNELTELIHRYSLNDRVFLMGSVDNIFDCIVDAKLFVMTSNYEGMPNALLEAMCIGLPVISTKVAGATDVIKNGYNGFLIDQLDNNGLATLMDQLVNDPGMRSNLSINAVKLYSNLRSDVIVDKWLRWIDIYKK